MAHLHHVHALVIDAGICIYGLTAIEMHGHIVQGFAAGRWIFICDSHVPEQKVSRLMLRPFHS